MTVMELIVALDSIGAPNDAEVFLMADHAQNKEQACSVVVSRSPIEEYADPDAMIWEWEGDYSVFYDDDDMAAYDTTAPITAVMITY